MPLPHVENRHYLLPDRALAALDPKEELCAETLCNQVDTLCQQTTQPMDVSASQVHLRLQSLSVRGGPIAEGCVMSKPRLLIAITAAFAFSVLGTPSPASASSLPSGEVTFGRTVVEPAYDDSTGTLVYLSTPMGAKPGSTVAPSLIVTSA